MARGSVALAWNKQAHRVRGMGQAVRPDQSMEQSARPEQEYFILAILSLRVKSRYTNMPVLHTNMQGQITPTVITTLLTHYTNRHHHLPVSTSRLTNHCHHVSESTLGPQ